MGKLTNLLKYKKEIIVRDEKGSIARDEEGKPVMVYMRVIGDKDLEEAQTTGRIASAQRRAALFDTESQDHLINVKIFNDAGPEECRATIVQASATGWSSEAYVVVELPELPRIEEIAKDPDAPTLEELEKLDKAISDVNLDYKEKVTEYIQTRLTELQTELEDKPVEELRERAKTGIIILLSIETYLNVVRDEKVWRSVYQDSSYSLKEFSSIEEFNNLHIKLKDQLRDEYENLEAGLDNVKN